MGNQLNINPEMDKLAREQGLGHWSCVSPLSPQMWVRSDGRECHFYLDLTNDNCAEYVINYLKTYAEEIPIGEDWQKPKQPTLVQKPFDYNYYRNNISKCVLFTNDGSFVKDIRIFSNGFSFKEKTLYVVTHKDNFHIDLNGKLIGSSDDSLIMFVWE